MVPTNIGVNPNTLKRASTVKELNIKAEKMRKQQSAFKLFV